MSHTDAEDSSVNLVTVSTPAERRKVALATMIGTTIEWYDFFIYANAAALVFKTLFFEPAGEQGGALISFASVGISFLFRPLGAIIAGHLGDRIGRKAMLVLTLFLMGGATFAIGLLPTFEAWGMAAPIILVLLRVLQGLSAGGEWGGAALMAVEFAPRDRRGFFGVAPQVGTPIGLLLATGVLALMGAIAPGDAFMEWGWRVPFLLSAVLIVVGIVVRRTVEESPVFREMEAHSERRSVPLFSLFRRHALLVLVAALTFAGNNALGYMTTGGFIQGYATNPKGPLHLDRTEVLLAVTVSAFVWLVSTMASGWLADRIGRKTTYIVGFACLIVTIFPMLWFVNSGSVVLLGVGISLFAIGLGLTYGPQSAFFAELFPASVRYSGVAISYAIGAILGGAFAPLIAQAIVNETGSTDMVGVYLLGMAVIGLAATLVLRDRRGIPLDAAHEAEQAAPPFVWAPKTPAAAVEAPARR